MENAIVRAVTAARRVFAARSCEAAPGTDAMGVRSAEQPLLSGHERATARAGRLAKLDTVQPG